MRNIYPMILLAALISPPGAVFAEPRLVVPASLIVGGNLQTFASIRLTEPATDSGLEITVTSDDPSRLLLARQPNEAGSKSLTLKVNPHYIEAPEFCVQALANSGTLTYTVSAPGFNSVRGTVKLAPSAILIVGPFRAPTFHTTPRGTAKINFYSALLDETGKFVAQQSIAGGLSVKVDVTSSDATVGSVTKSSLTLNGGESSASTEFKPAGVGETTLAANVPPGFSAAAEMATVKAIVEMPGIGVTGEINLGKDLQVAGWVLLGEPAPINGLDVTLTSQAPESLVLARRDDLAGTKSITIHVPAGEMRAPYFIQGLTDSGIVAYTATAPGYRSRVAPVTMAPSGIMVVYSPYGAPDEAEVLRAKETHDGRPFTISLSEGKSAHLSLWTVYLDPRTRRGADITAQSLRPGVTATVDLKNSNPAVAKVPSSVRITGSTGPPLIEFVPIGVGQTVISVSTAEGFATPSNATAVTAIVRE